MAALAASTETTNGLEKAVLGLIDEVARELHPQRRATFPRLDSSLERDQGIDSLARIELLARIERRFRVDLPAEAATAAETPRDLVEAVRGAGGSTEGLTRQPVERAALEETPAEARTLVEVLRWYAEHHPQRPCIHFLADAGTEVLTYGGLLERARRVAGGLRARDLQPGEAVGLMLPTGLDFFATLYGVLMAGGIPVPIYPPHRRSLIEEHLRRQAKILANAQARLLVTFAEARRLGRLVRPLLPDLRGVVTHDELAAGGAEDVRVALRGDDIALLQYTSGSTGDPKGVVLTHANLLANVRVMVEAAQVTHADTFVSWLPLYHDMGLIGACLGTLYAGCLLVLMSPLSFVARPRRWLRAIHRYRATLSAAPNFAYAICAAKLHEDDLTGLDLSCWRLAFNGAEPVNPDTIQGFRERLRPYGYRAEAMFPVYGLAEASLGLVFPTLGQPPRIDRVRRDVLLREGRAVPAGDDEQSLRFVCCGRPLRGHEVRIVDPAGRELGEREEGRIEFRGPSATRGYYRNPAATERLLRDGWLDTGDNGYVAEGELFITGRVKDLIIKAGHNIYPEELEQAVGEVEGIRKGCVAVFGVQDARTRTERIVVLAESRASEPARIEALRQAVERVADDVLGMPPDEVVIAPPHTVRKTSSGKIRRSACRELYAAGALGRQRAVWWQILRLGLSGLGPRLRRGARSVRASAYAVYFWTLIGLLVVPTWLILMLLPLRSWRRGVLRHTLRLAAVLLGLRLRIEGLEHLRGGGPYVLVSNHASYLDGLVLAAALPTRCAFAAKRELAGNPFLRLVMGRLGHPFVERLDAARGVQDVAEVERGARGGDWPVFFAEGTFVRAPGLREFRLGAFQVAAHTGAAVVPVALRGSRSVLRGDTMSPRRGPIEVTVCAPIPTSTGDWDEALRLRDAARVEVLARCGEPDLIEEAVSVG